MFPCCSLSTTKCVLNVRPKKIELFRQNKSPIRDAEIERFLNDKEMGLYINSFKSYCDPIVVNRLNDEPRDVSLKAYVCDLFGRD